MVLGASPEECRPCGIWEGTEPLPEVPGCNPAPLPLLGQAVPSLSSVTLFILSSGCVLAKGTILIFWGVIIPLLLVSWCRFFQVFHFLPSCNRLMRLSQVRGSSWAQVGKKTQPLQIRWSGVSRHRMFAKE